MGMENNVHGQKIRKEIPKRLWLANEVNLRLAVSNVEVAGKENIKRIPEGAKVVIMTTHLTDLDIPVSIHAVGKDLDVVVTNQSTHHKLSGPQSEAITNIGLHIAGKKNFIPIDYYKDKTGKKSPKAFNPDNFEPAVSALKEGKAVMIAAHNPSQETGEKLDDIKGSYGGVYLALLSDAYILPVTVALDRAGGMYEPSLLKTYKKLDRPNATAFIGQPFKLERVGGIERFSELAKKSGNKLNEEERIEFSKLADILREKSREVLKRMSEQSTTQN